MTHAENELNENVAIFQGTATCILRGAILTHVTIDIALLSTADIGNPCEYQVNARSKDSNQLEREMKGGH